MREFLKYLPLMAIVTLMSCGKDGGGQGIQGSNEIIITAADIKDLKLNFKTISPRHSWTHSFSKSIFHYLEERPELSTLVDADLRNSDLRLLKCEGYKKASLQEKKRFWVTFMASVAHAESSLNPMTTYREKDGTLSSGLLQIDIASANRHSFQYTGFFFGQEDLFKPDLNLMAGLYIMKHQLEGGIRGERGDIKNRLFTDANYYWSVLTYKRDLIIKTFTLNAKENLTFCLL